MISKDVIHSSVFVEILLNAEAQIINGVGSVFLAIRLSHLNDGDDDDDDEIRPLSKMMIGRKMIMNREVDDYQKDDCDNNHDDDFDKRTTTTGYLFAK